MSKKILGSIIVILIIAVGFYYQSQLSDDDGVKKVGFIYVGPVTDFGWTYEHDQGRKAVVEAFGEAVETTYARVFQKGPMLRGLSPKWQETMTLYSQHLLGI